MTKDLLIRAAKKSEAAELAILDDIASSGLASWIWYGGVIAGTANSALEHGRALMANPKLHFGYSSADIAEIKGETVGMSISYKMNMTERPASMGTKTDEVLDGCFRLMMKAHGLWYVDGLAVYNAHRRQGFARKLLSAAFEKAKQSQVSAITLITENDNKSALSLYKQMGFKLYDEEPFVPFYRQSTTEKWLLLKAAL
ncbi:MAG: GNAT family N-acetyltransferase [Rhizobiaceae bacterium]